jgi:hypothetical protein
LLGNQSSQLFSKHGAQGSKRMLAELEGIAAQVGCFWCPSDFGGRTSRVPLGSAGLWVAQMAPIGLQWPSYSETLALHGTCCSVSVHSGVVEALRDPFGDPPGPRTDPGGPQTTSESSETEKLIPCTANGHST